MLEALVTLSILSKDKLYKPEENWSSSVTSVPGKIHPSKPIPHPKYLMDFFSFRSSQVCNNGFQHIPPCLVRLHLHSQVKSFSPWFLLVGLFEGDGFISHLLEQTTARGCFSCFFLPKYGKGLDVLWHVIKPECRSVTPLCRRKSPARERELVHKYTASATAAAAASCHCQENSFLGFFPPGAVGFDQGTVGRVSLECRLR